jgi:hypothetical protein
MQDKPVMQQDWREIPRSEMFSRVITAVDAARGDALVNGDENYVRLCDEQFFPFLEAEKEKAREAERQVEEDFAHLVGRVGVSEEEARLMMRDDDLWIFDPAFRFGSELEGEEGVRQWEVVAGLAQGFAELADNSIDLSNPAATQLIGDAAARAEEALRRARARLEGASEE